MGIRVIYMSWIKTSKSVIQIKQRNISSEYKYLLIKYAISLINIIVNTNLPQAMFELVSLGPQAVMLPIEPTLLFSLTLSYA